jgi:predicted transcriptional regulator
MAYLTTASFANATRQNWVNKAILESLLRATQNYGDATKRHLMESSRLPFALFDDYFQYMLLNGLLQVKETQYENLYCLTKKGSETLNNLRSKVMPST